MKKAKLPKISEKEFQAQVLQFAKLHGWRTAHFRPAMTAKGRWVTAIQGEGKGFPDTVLVRGYRLIFAELKAGRVPSECVPTVEQQAWLFSLGKVAET